jgi:hypothetical protein
MRHLRGGYEGKHRQHATGALIIRGHRENPAFDRPSALQLNAAAAVLASASMLVGVAGPASAALEPARPATAQAAVAVAVSETVPIISNEGADRYVHLRGGRFIVDTREAAEAGALSSGNALAADLNRLVAAPAHTGDIVLTAATKATTYDLLPGVVLTVGSDYVQLALSKQVVTEIENLATIGQGITALVSAILAVSQVQGGSQIATIVADAIGIGDDAFKFCVGPDGNATFTISAELPFFACTGLSDLTA